MYLGPLLVRFLSSSIEHQFTDGIEDIRRQEDPDGVIDKIKTSEMEKKVLDLVNTRGRKTVDRKTFEKKTGA